MVRVPLYFQQTFATELYGALHDPEAESAVEKARASSAVKLANILGSPQAPGNFGARGLPTLGFAPSRPKREMPRASAAPQEDRGIGGQSKGLGSSEEQSTTRPKTYKVKK